MLVKHAFEEGGSSSRKGSNRGDQEVDVVEVFLAAKAVGEVVARVDGGAFRRSGGRGSGSSLRHLGGRPLAADADMGSGDEHGQVVAGRVADRRQSWFSPRSEVNEVRFAFPMGLQEDAD